MATLVGTVTLEQAKAALRLAHLGRRARCYAEALDLARACWARYEQLNRDHLPEDPVYSVVRSNLTPVAGSDYFTFIQAAARASRVLELIIGSEGTASAIARAVWSKSTGGVTGGGAQTPEKFHGQSPAASAHTSIFTTWTTQPTLSGAPLLALGWNALGGFIDWKAAPGSEIYLLGAEQHSWRNSAGAAVLDLTAIYEEL